ncbi:MAG: LysR family transcriptional regulator [Betaproteobacteria bacterium]|jgi:DNA-binding transcriptional LysR family regulator|nr:MAG: LysR family transcriptional regulator [Betaproteobacteria bacterium]
MELRHLRYFVAVATELHFGRAAEKLHISQPPLSMQIRALEDELGVILLRRTRRHVSLTCAGRAFLQDAKQILERTDQAILTARRAGRGEIGELAVGFISVADYNLLPLVLREFRRQYPMVTLSLKESTTDAQISDLTEGRIDVGFLLPPVTQPGIESVPILREPLIAALPEHHPLARKKGAIALGALAKAPFIITPRHMAPGLYDDIVSFCHSAGFSPQVTQEAIQMQTVVSLVSAEMGVALIPSSLKNLRRAGVVYKPLRENSPMSEIRLAWRNGDISPALLLFRDLAREMAISVTQSHVSQVRTPQ